MRNVGQNIYSDLRFVSDVGQNIYSDLRLASFATKNNRPYSQVFQAKE